jgi:hypothetical protein
MSMATQFKGYKVIPNGIPAGLISAAREEFDGLFQDADVAKTHPNVIELKQLDSPKIDAIRKIFDLVRGHIAGVPGYNVDFEKLWLVESKSVDTDMTKLPYIPHFDKRRYLKGMIYLNDVTADHGPIHLGETDLAAADKQRRNLPSDYKERGLNSVPAGTPMTPILGNAGTVILFDTNAPHHAGKVSPGMSRKVLRFDFLDKAWNASDLKGWVMSKLKAS